MSLLSMGCCFEESPGDCPTGSIWVGELFSSESSSETTVHSPSIKSGIASFNSRTMATGGTLEPILFQIGHSDPTIDINSLTVEARSRNPELIPDGNIEVDTSNAPNCSLIVTQAGDKVGSAQIKVSVRDPFGVSASVTFLVSIQDSSTN